MALAKNNKTFSRKVNLGKMLRETRDLRQFPMIPEQYKQFAWLAYMPQEHQTERSALQRAQEAPGEELVDVMNVNCGAIMIGSLLSQKGFVPAYHLIEGISAETLLADRGYDTNDILAYVVLAGMEPVIPPKKNRKEQRDYDKYLYKLRHLVENSFLALKCWRGIATRHAKISDAFIAAVHVRCIAIWAAMLGPVMRPLLSERRCPCPEIGRASCRERV